MHPNELYTVVGFIDSKSFAALSASPWGISGSVESKEKEGEKGRPHV
jgi:hypothetical protein